MVYQAIFCIINQGFSEDVMEAARSAGATGGTVIRARGTANPTVEAKFSFPIQPEKEIVMILVDESIKDAVLHSLYQNVGLHTPGKGIAFSMPIDNVVGLSRDNSEQKS